MYPIDFKVKYKGNIVQAYAMKFPMGSPHIYAYTGRKWEWIPLRDTIPMEEK